MINNKIKIPRGREGGRKPWTPSADQRDEVCRLRAAGMNQKDIAVVVGMCEATLVKCCYEELNSLYLKKKAAILRALEKKAIEGNVGAINSWLLICKNAELDFAPKVPAPSPKEPEEKLGKKEELDMAAKTAHKQTSWANKLQ